MDHLYISIEDLIWPYTWNDVAAIVVVGYLWRSTSRWSPRRGHTSPWQREQGTWCLNPGRPRGRSWRRPRKRGIPCPRWARARTGGLAGAVVWPPPERHREGNSVQQHVRDRSPNFLVLRRAVTIPAQEKIPAVPGIIAWNSMPTKRVATVSWATRACHSGTWSCDSSATVSRRRALFSGDTLWKRAARARCPLSGISIVFPSPTSTTSFMFCVDLVVTH
jgi:hypothetical protein